MDSKGSQFEDSKMRLLYKEKAKRNTQKPESVTQKETVHIVVIG